MRDKLDKWIVKDCKSGKLMIRFTVKGINKKQTICTGLDDTTRNREIVRAKRDEIANDIALERFDVTLEKYKFKPTRNTPTQLLQKAEKAYEYNLKQLWDRFTDYQSNYLEKTTILNSYATTARIISKLSTTSLKDAVKIRNYLIENHPVYHASKTMGLFKQCCEWAIDSELITENPFKKLGIPKPKKKSYEDEDCRAYSQEHRDIIIDAFENHRKYSHHVPLVKFLFWTGCRSGEAFALTWGNVNENCTEITIKESCNRYRIRKGTKNGKKRVFRTEISSKLQKLLLGIKPNQVNPSDLVFTTKQGKPYKSDVVNQIWNKSQSHQGNKKYCYSGVVVELVNSGKIPFYLKPYATRHTFATLAINKGMTITDVAYLIGDEVDTVLKYYVQTGVEKVACPDF